MECVFTFKIIDSVPSKVNCLRSGFNRKLYSVGLTLAGNRSNFFRSAMEQNVRLVAAMPRTGNEIIVLRLNRNMNWQFYNFCELAAGNRLCVEKKWLPRRFLTRMLSVYYFYGRRATRWRLAVKYFLYEYDYEFTTSKICLFREYNKFSKRKTREEITSVWENHA